MTWAANGERFKPEPKVNTQEIKKQLSGVDMNGGW